MCDYVQVFIYMSQIRKVGCEIRKMVCPLLKGSKAGTPADVQASWLDFTVHAQSFPTQEGEADDCDVI